MNGNRKWYGHGMIKSINFQHNAGELYYKNMIKNTIYMIIFFDFFNHSMS